MQKSNISWCTHTWNPVVGCPPPLASTGCSRCYARKLHNSRHKAYKAGKKLPGQYAKPFEEIQLFPNRLDDPLRCRAKDARIFVGSMSDLFHPDVPFDYISKVFWTIQRANWHTYMILTKRIERVLPFMEWLDEQTERLVQGRRLLLKHPFENLHIGTSISTQADADKNIPILLQIPAAIRFVSLEPMLERIDIEQYLLPTSLSIDGHCWKPRPVWVIIGCESGPGARLCTLDDIRYVLDQTRASKTPTFLKQIPINGKCSKDPKEWPIDLQGIQEYPK